MNIWQIVLKEILRRKLNFILGLSSLVVAVTVLVGAITSLKIHDIQTQEIIAKKEAETQQRMLILEDDYRKIMKKLGFNLLILPRDQNLSDLYAQDFASKYMPEDYTNILSQSKIMSIRHLLPSLQQRIYWPEKKRTIILIGTRGEVPLLHRDPKEAIIVPVPKGSVVVGYELHRSYNISVGDTIGLLGHKFRVTQCNEQRGNKDDITLWIDLKKAQALLNRPNQINAILALKCVCAGNDISSIRSELAAILPGTQVIEQTSKVLTRAEARERAAREAQEAIDSEKRHRQQVREQQERFATIYVPIIIGICALWIALLFLANVKERKSEIGILRAVGVRAGIIIELFLLKAAVLGIFASIIGIALGLMVSLFWKEAAFDVAYINWRLILIAVFLAPFISLLASWIPALMASQQDPAVVLREE